MTTQTIPQDTINIVNPIAQKYGVPPQLWETIAAVESGFNPQAVGDNGTSYGLFQLHIGGQLPAQYNNNPKAVFNPGLNSQLALPSIGAAWQQLKGQAGAPTANGGGGSIGWWQKFAAASGHPGGAPGQLATNQEAAKLQNEFAALGANPVLGTTTPTPASGTTGIPTASILDPGAWIQANIISPITGAASSIGIFLLAFVVLIVGFVVIASGGTK